MRIIPLAAFSLALTLCIPVFAQQPSPSPTSSPTPTLRQTVDGLSQGDLENALKLLKANYLNPTSLTEQELNRATLQGVVDRLGPGVAVFDKAPIAPEASPFRAEILDGRVGYLRLGSLAKGNVDEMDTALQNFNAKGLKSVILDLRATPESTDFDLAAEVIKRFTPKGKLLFTIKKTNVKQERITTSNIDPVYQGIVVVLVDGDTAGAGEVIASALRANANAMIIGQKTAGEAVEFSDLPLSNGKVLRVAVSEVVLPGDPDIYPKGVNPDLVSEMSPASKRQVLALELDKAGVSPLVFETERVHLNEAALVAGTNPDIDAYQAAMKIKPADRNKPQLRDTVLQRALDFITTVGIYEAKPSK